MQRIQISIQDKLRITTIVLTIPSFNKKVMYYALRLKNYHLYVFAL